MNHERRIDVPPIVVNRAKTLGEVGERWLAQLNETVALLQLKWAFQSGEVLSGGSESLVMTAALPNNKEAILKIGLFDLADEAAVYQLADGQGYPQLLAHAPQHNAILLERLGKPLATLDLPVDEQITILCQTIQTAWRPLSTSNGFMTGAEKAYRLIAYIDDLYKQFPDACRPDTIKLATTYATTRAEVHESAEHVLVHGDAHSHNALIVETNLGTNLIRCKLIDPDGLCAEPAYDLAIPMREWSNDLLAGDALTLGQARCQLLAQLTNIDAEAIWQWGFVERVSTGLTLLKIGMKREGLEMLEVANIWATR